MTGWRRSRAPENRPGDVLITGASRGFGRLIAAGLAARGWRVFATMRDPSARGGLDEAVSAAGGDLANVTVLALDVRSTDSVDRTVSEVLELTGGRLDAVVANAGIFLAGAFEETPTEAMRDVMETNYFGALATVRAALPALRAARGRIVVMSSDSGLCGTPAMSGYTASKFALEGWGESLAYELEPLGVTVSLIEPGPFMSDMLGRFEVHRVSTTGPYAAMADATEHALHSLARAAPPPGPVVDAVIRALSDGRPRLRYPVGAEARIISTFRGILPERVFGAVVRRATRIDAR
jgi:NAD(P)-dependent dehydrogenase (short-subunit alcohol dehydrogenase family)